MTMNQDPRFVVELHKLCCKLRDGEITDAESQRLDAMLRDSRDARRFYRAFMALASALESRATVQDAADQEADAGNNPALLSELLQMELAAEELEMPAQPQPVEADRPRQQRDEALGWREIAGASGYLLGRALVSRPARYAYAAMLLVSAILTIAIIASSGTGSAPTTAGSPNGVDPPADRFSPPTAVATLTAEHNAQWAAFNPGPGDTLYAKQRLTLTEGFAEITTARGAIAILEAPATIELTDSDNALRLHTGKLVGICETPSSKGFLVHTPHMDVTDLGTRFGVDASSADTTEAHVLEGEIEVARRSSRGRLTARQNLSAGQAVRATSSGPGFVAIGGDRKRFAAISAYAEPFRATEASEAGIAALTGDTRWSPRGAYLNRSRWRSDDRAVVFEELSSYRLVADAPVTLLGPGNTSSTSSIGKTLPDPVIQAGTTVRTYVVLLYSDTPDHIASPRGSITFEGEVLGIATHEEQARAFTDQLADPTHLAPVRVAAYHWMDADRDQASLQDDGRTVRFAFSAGGGTTDAIRVFVRVPQE